jgi:hypothetical protein
MLARPTLSAERDMGFGFRVNAGLGMIAIASDPVLFSSGGQAPPSNMPGRASR